MCSWAKILVVRVEISKMVHYDYEVKYFRLLKQSKTNKQTNKQTNKNKNKNKTKNKTKQNKTKQKQKQQQKQKMLWLHVAIREPKIV